MVMSISVGIVRSPARTKGALHLVDDHTRICRAVRGKSGGRQGKEFACEFRLGRARPVGLQPTDSIRGHPRLGAVETKTWMRGSSPRKTILTRFLGVLYKCSLQGNFPRTALPLA